LEAAINPLRDFPSIFATTLSIEEMVVSLTVAMLCGIVIAQLYRITFAGSSYSVSYVRSLVAFVLITSIVIMVIGNNLARAFGLVGSMSIIRFRMAIKDTRDIVFIFFSLAIGMATGTGQHMMAVMGTFFLSIVIYTLAGLNFGSYYRREFLLQFQYSYDDNESAPYIKLFKSYCSKSKLINIHTVGETDTLEMSYYLTMKKPENGGKLVHTLRGIDGVTNVNLFYDEE
jgi:uncharacterized membrane protein YhiD involved in acid resistance